MYFFFFHNFIRLFCNFYTCNITLIITFSNLNHYSFIVISLLEKSKRKMFDDSEIRKIILYNNIRIAISLKKKKKKGVFQTLIIIIKVNSNNQLTYH